MMHFSAGESREHDERNRLQYRVSGLYSRDVPTAHTWSEHHVEKYKVDFLAVQHAKRFGSGRGEDRQMTGLHENASHGGARQVFVVDHEDVHRALKVA